MDQETSMDESNKSKHTLLKDQVQLVKRKDSDQYEVVPIHGTLSFDKGLFTVVRACQMLALKNDGVILVGIAGPSGAGKTIFTEKLLNVMGGVAVISLDNYFDSSRVVDGNFDDPRVIDYDTLLQNLQGLKEGNAVEVPIYDFKSLSRTGYRRLEVPRSHVVIIEGTYALSAKLQSILDARVSITGGVHFDLVKRVLRDIQRSGQAPQAIIHHISETVYPMYKAFIEPDLHSAHIKIINKFNPFSGFQNPTYILKSARKVTADQIKAVMPIEHTETKEETFCIYLLPPGEDPESCQSYLRMQSKERKCTLMFQEWVIDKPFIISPRITFEVSVRLLGRLMALGYKIVTSLKRSSHVYSDEKVCVKMEWLDQLKRQYVQVQGRDRFAVENVAEKLGLGGSYIPRTYIEQIQIEKLVNEDMALPEDLIMKLGPHLDIISSPKETLSGASPDTVLRRNEHLRGLSQSYTTQSEINLSKFNRYAAINTSFHDIFSESHATLANQKIITELSEQISSVNDRMDYFKSQIEELEQYLNVNRDSPSQLIVHLQAEASKRSAPTGHCISSLGNDTSTDSMRQCSSSAQLARGTTLSEEVAAIAQLQQQNKQQLDNLVEILHNGLREMRRQESGNGKNMMFYIEYIDIPVVALTVAAAGIGVLLFKGLLHRN